VGLAGDRFPMFSFAFSGELPSTYSGRAHACSASRVATHLYYLIATFCDGNSTLSCRAVRYLRCNQLPGFSSFHPLGLTTHQQGDIYIPAKPVIAFVRKGLEADLYECSDFHSSSYGYIDEASLQQDVLGVEGGVS
jgi:hypothetical protein